MKSGVGGLFVHRDEIYYSCCEKYTQQPGEIYTLHICNKAGESKRVLGGFNHIRGIDKDTSDCIYVVDSSNKRILKFDRDWNPLRRTSKKDNTDQGTVLTEPFGITVTPEHVLVCAYRKKEICIFDHDLNLQYRIDHPYLESGPIDITEFDGRFIVAIKSAILVLEIDFVERTFEVTRLDRYLMNNGKIVPFNRKLELRGVCASDQYLYVAEGSGRLLCFIYTDSQLRYVNAIPSCSPVAAVHDGTTVYYSRRITGGRFAIAEVTHDESGGKMNTKDIFTV